jgi:hypothetical protein
MDTAKLIAELRTELQLIDQAIFSLARIGIHGKRRGRPPVWMKNAAVKKRGRPAGSKNKPKEVAGD